MRKDWLILDPHTLWSLQIIFNVIIWLYNLCVAGNADYKSEDEYIRYGCNLLQFYYESLGRDK